MKTCIIGAGLTGITIAKNLPNSIILEKSRGVGGRFAARRLGSHPINHGPLSFQEINDPHAWIKNEAKDLNILNCWEVSHFVIHDNKRITLYSKADQEIECSRIIFTSPAQQTKSILQKSDMNADFLNEVKYKSIIQFMVLAQRDIDFNEISIFMDLKHKINLESNLSIFLFEVKDFFNDKFLDYDKEDINEFFSSKLPQGFLETHAHKWRYAEVTQSIDSKFSFYFFDKNIILAGDYFGTNGFESSLESARAVLNRIR